MSDRRSPDPTEPAAVHDYPGFWAALSAHCRVQGLPSKAVWLRRINEIYARNGRVELTKTTFYDRMKGRRIGWDEARLIITAIPGVDPDEWRAPWERAERRWLADLRRPREQPGLPDGTTPAPLPEEPVAVTAAPPPPVQRRSVPVLALAVAASIVAGLSLVVLGVGRGPAPSAAADPQPAPPVVSSAPAPSASAGPTQAPTSSATSAKNKAHAEFRRGTGEFLIYDDDRDGRSAVLQFMIDGAGPQYSFNTRGMTDDLHPPKSFTPPGITSDSAVRYRVCVVDYGSELRPETCGAWSRDPTP